MYRQKAPEKNSLGFFLAANLLKMVVFKTGPVSEKEINFFRAFSLIWGSLGKIC